MYVEDRMSKMGLDCDALPKSPKRPLSQSLRRSVSNRSIKLGDRGLNPKPQQQATSTPPRSLFSLQTTTSPSAPTLPPLPVARSKHFQARSLSFSSHETEKHRPADCESPAAVFSSPGPVSETAVEGNIVKSPEKDRLGGVQPDGPSVFVKSFFRSSTFSALRARSFRSREEAMEVPESSPYSLLSGPSDKQRVSPIVEIENSFGVLTKGLLDSSRNAVKAVQDKARHLVNKRYQEGGFQLDMVYITGNIIAMGFPGNDSGPDILGFKEGNYRDNIEELVTFCETQHPDKYKIFNLCSEKLYDTSLLHDKVACFPFEGNSCPPLLLITAFCEAAYAWLKAGLENVVVVHCKRGLARTGLMISCLLLHLKFFPTAEESMNFYNQKRCVDSNGLNIPSQLRYVKYYEQVLKKHHGFTPTGRRCTMRSIRLINCPSWIRPAVTVSDHDGVVFTSKKLLKTRSTLAEDVWLSAVKSGVILFELPEDGHAAAVDGDFKIHFQDRNVDFSCWLNTNMVGAGNIVLRVNDLDGYEKGLQEATGFQLELELLDTYLSVLKVSGTVDLAPTNNRPSLPSDMTTPLYTDTATDGETTVFTDSEGEEEERPGVSAQPSSREWEAAAAATTINQTAFQSAVSQAVTEISTGFLNAMDRFGMRTHVKSASMPNSPRHQQHQHGSAQYSDGEKDTAASSRFRSSKEVLRKQFTYDFEAGEAARITTVDSDGSNRELSVTLACENSGVSFRSDDPGSLSRSEEDVNLILCDPPSEFQALAAASAADASLFSFGDDEDYDSDEV